MVWIERIAVHVAALDAFGRERFALLFDDARFPVMTRCATGHHVVQRRERIAIFSDPESMWSTATATVNCPSFRQYSQSGFCCSFIRRKRCQRCVLYGHFAIASPYQGLSRRSPAPAAPRYRPPCRSQQSGRCGRWTFRLLNFRFPRAVHFDSAIGRRHF